MSVPRLFAFAIAAFLPLPANSACVSMKPIASGVCSENKPCMCDNDVNSRLTIPNLPFVKHCDDKVAVNHFQVAPRFSYPSAKKHKQYAVLFTQFNSKTDASRFVHWFEMNIPGASIQAGKVQGFAIKPYRPLDDLANTAQPRSNQLMLFEQPTRNMVVKIPQRRQWSNADFAKILREYGLCNSLVAAFQYQVSSNKASSKDMNMCSSTSFSGSSAQLGIQAEPSGLKADLCICVLSANVAPIRMEYMKITCPSVPKCPWQVKISANILHAPQCDPADGLQEDCCDVYYVPHPGSFAVTIINKTGVIWAFRSSYVNEFMGTLLIRATPVAKSAKFRQLQVDCGENAKAKIKQLTNNCGKDTQKRITTTTAATLTAASTKTTTTPISSGKQSGLTTNRSRGVITPASLGSNRWDSRMKFLSGLNILLLCAIISLIALVAELLGVFLWDRRQRGSKKIQNARQSTTSNMKSNRKAITKKAKTNPEKTKGKNKKGKVAKS